MSKIIEIIVSPSGETRLETQGFQGGACRDASRFVEHALGQRTSEQLTADFHLGASAIAQQQTRT